MPEEVQQRREPAIQENFPMKKQERSRRSAKNAGKREEILISGFEYHIINSNCIYLRIRDSNIYMYIKKKYTKKSSKKI
jgi:hypothetical protein